MFKKILVPITSSTDYGASSLKYAIEFAKIFKAQIRGVFIKDVRLLEGGYVYVPDSGEDQLPMRGHLAEKGQTIRDYFNAECAREKVQSTFVVKEGLISSIICKESKKADLIVMGKKGESSQFLAGFLGSAANRVIDNTELPLLVVDETYNAIKHVTLAYSGGVYATRSLDLSKLIAKGRRAKLSILTIMDNKKEAELLQDTAKQYFKASRSLKPVFDVASGKPDSGVKNYIGKNKSSLLIVGSSKKRGLNLFFSNQLAKYILKRTSIPVLLMR